MVIKNIFSSVEINIQSTERINGELCSELNKRDFFIEIHTFTEGLLE